ncbi:unnamed protein product [Prorocentrum cordatum]|uniref:Uncharacterized protein n=1 Tax=Prorocentrum cordatum TaxID=2364126 RepID=A0ABN9RG89_9DINO|nr:unnamed protein product [Polarella glacialis]
MAPGVADATDQQQGGHECKVGTALAAAARAQAGVAARAAAATEEAKNSVAFYYDAFGGAKVEALLDDIDLIDVAYMISIAEAGGTVPRWQNVPPTARINRTNAWRLRSYGSAESEERPLTLPILVVSYPWLDKSHPDQHGLTLRRMLPVLRALYEQATSFGSHTTVGVFQDFMSLPQIPRTSEEYERFRRGLATMAGLYAHPYTIVLTVTTPIPGDGSCENTVAYARRGWCHFERCVASLVKDTCCLWDLGRHAEGLPTDVRRCMEDLRASRLAPTSPDQMAKDLSQLAFTNGADIEKVIDLQAAFIRAFNEYRQNDQDGSISYQSLRWGGDEKQVSNLVAALQYAESECQPKDSKGVHDAELRLYFGNNNFSPAEEERVRQAIPFASAKFQLYRDGELWTNRKNTCHCQVQ